MSAPVYQVAELSKARVQAGSGFALSVPELTIRPGERVALVGDSGCGKSTLLDMLGLASSPDGAGRFTFCPRGAPSDIPSLWRDGRSNDLGDLRKHHIGYVLQTGGLIPYLTVRQNIDLTRRLLDLPDDGTADALAERLGLAGHGAKLPAALSVGERQRVAIGRALAHRPPVILADEPTASLDPETAKTVMALFLDLVEAEGATLIVATHDRAQVGRLGLRALGHDLARDPAAGLTRARFWG
ncbi:MAG: ABC transporter ATP-binding protein [Rhodobacterales bacterium]|nr:ABC transporter ATP-binding protein [Rhodobacterales bacterium]